MSGFSPEDARSSELLVYSGKFVLVELLFGKASVVNGDVHFATGNLGPNAKLGLQYVAEVYPGVRLSMFDGVDQITMHVLSADAYAGSCKTLVSEEVRPHVVHQIVGENYRRLLEVLNQPENSEIAQRYADEVDTVGQIIMGMELLQTVPSAFR